MRRNFTKFKKKRINTNIKGVFGIILGFLSILGAIGSFMALMATWITFLGLFFAKVLFTVASITTTLTWGMIFWVPALILIGGITGILLGLFGTVLAGAMLN